MNKTQASRLKTLADFLRDQVPEENFNQAWYRSGGLYCESMMDHGCKSSACALGWAVEIFPNQLGWSSRGTPILRNTGHEGAIKIGSYLFGTDPSESRSLFGQRYATTRQKCREIYEVLDAHGWE